MRIAVIGSGYVGLVSGLPWLISVTRLPASTATPTRSRLLNAGKIPIFEPGLDQIVSTNARANRLVFTTDLEEAVSRADAVFIAVGTPSRRGDGHADLSLCLRRRAEHRRQR